VNVQVYVMLTIVEVQLSHLKNTLEVKEVHPYVFPCQR
jgi:hypothetical protein